MRQWYTDMRHMWRTTRSEVDGLVFLLGVFLGAIAGAVSVLGVQWWMGR